jgi:hypothetical protein
MGRAIADNPNGRVLSICVAVHFGPEELSGEGIAVLGA